MKVNSNHTVKLVFTVALKKEIPVQWLGSQSVKVVSLKALKSGILSKKNADVKNSGVLFVITGVGYENSREAALWLAENIRPEFVVNLGSACARRESLRLGSWVMPSHVVHWDGRRFLLADFLPFSWMGPEITKGSGLFTSPFPVEGKWPDNLSDCQLVDMEASGQAEVFSDGDIPFSILKRVTDYGDEATGTTYHEQLGAMRAEIKKGLGFLGAVHETLDVGVIIPVHNRRHMISRCVQSVLNQTLSPKRIIVVDDGSNDGTCDVIKKFRDIEYIRLGSNQGVSHARNIGVKELDTRWICFLDSDDEWLPEKLESQLRFVISYPFLEIMQSEEIWIRNGKRVNPCKHHRKPSGWIWRESLNLCLVSPSSVMLRRDLFNEIGGFDESLPACEDYDLWLRISRRNLVGLDTNPVVVKYGGHPDQLSQRYEAMDRFRVYSLYKALLKEQSPWCASELKAVLKKKISILLNGCIKRDKKNTAELLALFLDEIDRDTVKGKMPLWLLKSFA